MVYIEVAVSNMMLDDSAIGKMINHFWESSPEQIQEFMRNNSLGIADVKKIRVHGGRFCCPACRKRCLFYGGL